MMDDGAMLTLLRHDLQRLRTLPQEDAYLTHLLQVAKASLERQGIQPEEGEDWAQVVVGTAAWIYRKRITGESEPMYLRRMRLDLIISQQARR